MSAYAHLLDLAGDNVKRRSHKQSDLLCPAHEDRSPSLSLGVRMTGDPGAVVKCQAGCRTEDVLAEWPGGPLTTAALYDHWWERHDDDAGGAIEVYVYTDEAGTPLFEVGRFEPGFNGAAKTFLQRRPG